MKEQKVAKQAAKKAGDYLKNQFKKYDPDFNKKKEGSFNLVTESDQKSEEILVETIQESFPSHSIRKEESDPINGNTEFSWYIDPIDGTTNFAQKIPHFCVSVALYKSDKPALGLVFNPATDELFYADTKEQCAYLNGEMIEVSPKSKLDECILATGFPYNRSGDLSMKNVDNIRSFLKLDVGGMRRMGAAALDLCYVGCGRFDGYWEYDLCSWDHAAGAIILNQAGGRVSDPIDSNYSVSQEDIVSSNGNIHSKMLDVIK